MRILRVQLSNFKGIREGLFKFNGKRTLVKGPNGCGKSTILDAILWVLVDRDVKLVSNPNIRPITAIDEDVVSVTIDFDFDGKEVQVQKSQKFKRSKNDTTSLSNSYMVNAVPKSEKAFREYFTELGVDFDKYLPSTHPAVLLDNINNKKERTALRNLLFEMATDVTDEQIAEGDEELSAIAEQLKTYTAEEIEAVQNQTLRKIRENYGNEGELLRKKIEGLSEAKIEIDEDFHKTAISNLENDIAEIDKQIADLDEVKEKVKWAFDLVLEKKFDLNELEQEAIKDEIKRRSAMDNDIFRLERDAVKLQEDIDRINSSINVARSQMESDKQKVEANKQVLAKIEQKTFDESSCVCPTCGQKYPPDQTEEMIRTFEENKEKRIAGFNEAIIGINDRILKTNDQIKNNTQKAHDLSNDLKAVCNSLAELRAMRMELGNVPKPDMSGNEKYQQIKAEIAESEQFIHDNEKIDTEIHSLKVVRQGANDELVSHKIELSKVDQNKRIDSQIEQLRIDQMNYEQRKADAEMILDQLKLLNKKKNELLEESVNSNFTIIKWKLWDRLKNGEYKDACIPMVDGKMFGQSMNTALEIRAKIDAMNGIQRFFGFDYPILVDDCEHLDSQNLKQVESDHQLIMMAVSDGRMVFEND